MTLYDFFSGMVAGGFFIAALFFLRFWRRTRDRLFLSFAGAFFLLGAGQCLLALGGLPVEERSWIYLTRLAAFLLILWAIYSKNRNATSN
ncbi:DUF5985 family protein [Sphingomonas arenae]|uniref:DUF5985 family protein n=1 Tax=Sphingomonas arenae TaxID=2812555 RepID=UPI00196789EA|nr:DUF5985 family protein [Sphingomonas arenae]